MKIGLRVRIEQLVERVLGVALTEQTVLRRVRIHVSKPVFRVRSEQTLLHSPRKHREIIEEQALYVRVAREECAVQLTIQTGGKGRNAPADHVSQKGRGGGLVLFA